MLEEYTSFADDKFTIDDLLRRSWRIRDSKEFQKIFDFIAKIDHYSHFNTMLVYLQNDAVTFFGGVSFWKKKFHRTIKENASPYIILAPRGPVMLVYDVFDTEGEDSPEEFLRKGIGHNPFEVNGQIRNEVLQYAIQEAEKWGIRVLHIPLSYFNAGYITTILSGKLEIKLKKEMTNEEKFATFIHELAHLFLGHTGHAQLKYSGKEKSDKLPVRKLSTTAEELEAETVSYLICHRLSLETRSAEYIGGYIKSENDLLTFSYENVVRVADKIEKLFINTRIRNMELPTHLGNTY